MARTEFGEATEDLAAGAGFHRGDVWEEEPLRRRELGAIPRRTKFFDCLIRF